MADEECLPPEGTKDFTMHWLSREVGDGSIRQDFQALWYSGSWLSPGIQSLSPKKAASITYIYVRPFGENAPDSTLEERLFEKMKQANREAVDLHEQWKLAMVKADQARRAWLSIHDRNLEKDHS